MLIRSLVAFICIAVLALSSVVGGSESSTSPGSPTRGLGALGGSQGDIFDRVTHGTSVSEGGVKIHDASLGKAPLVVMIHGFPDFWYSWRHQMDALEDTFQVVPIDH
jgi:pimeloyl-ACP methyl ester carboxylesterase